MRRAAPNAGPLADRSAMIQTRHLADRQFQIAVRATGRAAYPNRQLASQPRRKRRRDRMPDPARSSARPENPNRRPRANRPDGARESSDAEQPHTPAGVLAEGESGRDRHSPATLPAGCRVGEPKESAKYAVRADAGQGRPPGRNRPARRARPAIVRSTLPRLRRRYSASRLRFRSARDTEWIKGRSIAAATPTAVVRFPDR